MVLLIITINTLSVKKTMRFIPQVEDHSPFLYLLLLNKITCVEYCTDCQVLSLTVDPMSFVFAYGID